MKTTKTFALIVNRETRRYFIEQSGEFKRDLSMAESGVEDLVSCDNKICRYGDSNRRILHRASLFKDGFETLERWTEEKFFFLVYLSQNYFRSISIKDSDVVARISIRGGVSTLQGDKTDEHLWYLIKKCQTSKTLSDDTRKVIASGPEYKGPNRVFGMVWTSRRDKGDDKFYLSILSFEEEDASRGRIRDEWIPLDEVVVRSKRSRPCIIGEVSAGIIKGKRDSDGKLFVNKDSGETIREYADLPTIRRAIEAELGVPSNMTKYLLGRAPSIKAGVGVLCRLKDMEESIRTIFEKEATRWIGVLSKIDDYVGLSATSQADTQKASAEVHRPAQLPSLFSCNDAPRAL